MQENDATDQAVYLALLDQWKTEERGPSTHDAIDVLLFTAKLICDRLRAGGIGNLTILNAIVTPHKTHREITRR